MPRMVLLLLTSLLGAPSTTQARSASVIAMGITKIETVPVNDETPVARIEVTRVRVGP